MKEIARKSGSAIKILEKKLEQELGHTLGKQERLRKINWLNSVDSLYTSILSWLESLIEKGLVKYEKVNIRKSEKLIGTYNIDNLKLFIGTHKIELLPVGTYILGGYGRIDIKHQIETKHLILSQWNEWKILQDKRSVKLSDLTQDSFIELINSFINNEN